MSFFKVTKQSPATARDDINAGSKSKTSDFSNRSDSGPDGPFHSGDNLPEQALEVMTVSGKGHKARV